MTHEEANQLLNAFAGWTPGQKCAGGIIVTDPRREQGPGGPWKRSISHQWCRGGPFNGDHDIPQADYFADTPEAREAVRLLKDEFVRRELIAVRVTTYTHGFVVTLRVDAFKEWVNWADAPIEHHAIAYALAAALKERGE